MATDFNALYKEFLTRLKDNDFYADFLSFISRGDNYRLSYDNQIITFMQAGSAFELHTYNDYIQKGYKPFGSYSALLYKRFDLSEGNRKLWADDSVRKIGSVENTDKVNESDKYHAEFPVISDNAVLDRLYSALQNDGIFSHKWDENSDIKEKIKNSISDLTRTLVRGILGGKDSENVSRSALVYYGNMESAVEFGMLSKLGMADEHEYNALVNPFSALEGDIDRKTADLYFFSLHDCLMAVEEPIYQCFIKNKAEITDGYEIINNKLVASVTEPVMEKETDYDLRGHEGDAEEGRVGEVRASDRGRAEDTSGGVAELQEEQDEIRRQAQIPGTLSGRVSEGFGLLDSDNNGRATGTADSDIQPSSSPDNLGNASGLRSSVDEQRRDELSFRVHGRQSEPEPERSGENDSRGEMEVLLRDGRLSSGRTAEGSGKADVTDSGLRGLQPAVSEPGNGGVVSGQRSEFQDGHDNGHSTAGNSVQILQGDGSIRQVHSTADEGDGKEGAVSVQNDRQPVPSGSNGDGRGEAGVRPSAASIHNGADAEAVRSANLTDDYTDNLLADSSGQLSFDFTGINEAEKRKKVDSFLDDVQNGSFVPEYDSDDESIRVDVSNPGQSQNINRDNFAKYDIDSQLSFLPEEQNYESYTYKGFIKDMMANRKNTSDFNYVRTSDNKVVPTFIASALLAGTCYQGDKVDIADYFLSAPHSLNGDDCEFLKQKYNGKGKGFVYTDLNGDRRFAFFIPSDFPNHSDDISKYEQSGLFIGRYEPNDDGRMVFKKAFVSWKYISFGLDNMIYDINCYTHIPKYDEKSESHKFIGYDDYPSYFNHKTDEFKNYIKQSKVKLVAFYKHKKEFDSYASDPLVSDLSYKHQEQICSDYLSNEAYVPYAVFAPKNYAPSIGDKFSIDDLKNPKNPHDGELLYLSLAVHQYHIPMKVGDVISIHEKDGSETYHYCNPSSDGTLLYEKVDDSFFPLTLEETSFLRHFLNPEDSRYQIDAYDIVDEHDAEIINSINEKLGDKQLTVQIGSLINALNGKVSEYLNKSSKLLQNDVSEINDNVIDSSIKEGDSADDEKAGNPEKQVQNIEETKTDSDTISESDTLNNASDVSDNEEDASDDQLPSSDILEDAGGEAVSDDVETSYYTYPSNFKSPSGIKNRLSKNIAAIKVLKEINHRPATKEEQQILSEYTGFGGLQLVFDERAEAYENERAELKEVLSKEEYHSAQSSIMDAFYTPKEVVESVYECLEKMGFRGGKVLDPSMGVGRFYSFMPKEMRENSELYGVEIDGITEKIAALLNPDCKSYNLPFEDADVIYDSAHRKPFDLVISNIPFGELRIKDSDFKKAYRIHDYFFMKALNLVKEGGIVAFITSTGTLDKLDARMRDDVFKQADLVAAYRLPNNIFSNTSVSSDIIFLQKGRANRVISDAVFNSENAEDYGFRNVIANDYGIAYNNYYFEHPDMLLGRMENSGRFGGSVCVPYLEGTFTEHFKSSVLPQIPENIVAETVITKEKDISSDGLNNNPEVSDNDYPSEKVINESENDFTYTPLDDDKSDTENSLELGDEIDYSEVKENLNPDDLPYLDVNPGALFVYSGKVYRRQSQSAYSPCYRVVPAFAKKSKNVFKTFKNWEKKAIRLINLRNSFRKLVYLELNDSLEEDIENERANLNRQYNEFVVKYGFLSKKDQLKGFVTENFDQDSQLFTAFEDTEKYIDENGEEKERIVKAGIFSKRQYTAYIPPVHADSIEDALNIAYVEKNEVDFDRISSLLDGMSKDDIIKNLKGQIFKDPETYSPSHPYDGYLIKEDYLSGNVREKLNLAKTKAVAFSETNPHIFDENIEALEKVVPKDIPAEEISVDIGAPWIDPQDYRKFMSELTHTYIGFFDVKYFSLTSTYYVENRTTNSFSNVFDSAECETVFGTQYMNFYKIFENLLNQRPIKVEIKAKDSEGNEYVLQQPSYEATVEAKTKAEEIKAQFKDWIFSDTERREKYVRLYNDRFNSTVLRQYDGSYMEFPGINSAIQLYDYQKDGISRCIRGGNTLLAYCVGAGKSFMMIASAMEMKRLGLCRKSLIVVPKATVPQMYSEFKRLYPNSNALMITSGNFTKKKRAQFLANVALGNYDAIIMSHDQFNMVKLSDERRREYITAEIEQLQDYLSNEDSTERFTIRQIEKEIEKLQTNLDKVGKTSTDTIFTFEELGVDALFLDEAHNYKNMYFATKLSNISGVSTSASERSLNLSFILQYLAEINHGYRNVIFATGTPVSNSMSEMYNFTRFLRPDLLKASGLYAFDAWASTFGDVTHNLEPKPDGNGFQFKDRFAKFKNLPELTTMYRSFADVKLLSDIKDHLDAIPKLKNGKPTIIKCEPNDVIKAAMKEFSERSERVHSNGFIAQKGEDNYLKIINDGRKLSVDTQLYLPSAPEYEGSKINACVREVFRIYNETASFKGTQAIFLDAGVPNGQTYVNLYKKIKDKLTALGVPSEEIAFVQNYGDEKKKDMLMSSLNNGNIRIVLGSTQTLGTGCNFQERLYAIHELDAPWTPASVEQREGRIIRQGNKNPEVEIYRYIMQDTFDTFNWTTLDRKKDFIDQSISGTFEGRDVEDAEMAASYADIKQACTTNPYIQKKFENDNKISILSAQKKAFKSNNYHIQSELHNLPKYKKMYEENISDFSKDIEARDKYKEELSKKIAAYNEKCEDPKKKIAVTDTPFEITIGDTTYYNRNEANDKIIKIFEAMENGDQKTIGKYYGFSLVASRECMDKSAGNGYINYSITIRGTTNYTANFEISGKDGRGNMMKLQNQLLKMEEYKARNEKMLEDAKAKEAVLKEQVDKPFEGEAELAQCLKDREEFELRINEFEAEHASEEEDYSYIDLEEYKRIPGEDKISEADVVDEPVGVHDISVSDEVEENDQEKHTEESHNEIAEAYDADITDKEKGQDNEDLDDDISDNMAINANSRK